MRRWLDRGGGTSATGRSWPTGSPAWAWWSTSYLHLAILSSLLRGPEARDGLVALFRQPLFVALDVLLVAGLAFHGLNGLRVALVGSGLLADRHKALAAAAAILAGLVAMVAAVRLLA
jgi:succinate dehydrogenase / fumarate reductase cytochrome b subunit